jgi:hypothetical protein
VLEFGHPGAAPQDAVGNCFDTLFLRLSSTIRDKSSHQCDTSGEREDV